MTSSTIALDLIVSVRVIRPAQAEDAKADNEMVEQLRKKQIADWWEQYACDLPYPAGGRPMTRHDWDMVGRVDDTLFFHSDAEQLVWWSRAMA